MKIQVTSANNYGSTVYYPFNKEAELITRLTETKTIPLWRLQMISEDGHEVEVVVQNHQTKEVVVVNTI